MRPTRYDVDLDALRHNVGVLSGIAAGATFCAVVKADGCGHGAVPVARAAVEAAVCLRLAVCKKPYMENGETTGFAVFFGAFLA
jgi:alanine racemase